MSKPDFVTVRRASNSPFRVLPGDLDSEDQQGYDLSLVRNLRAEGLTTSITVQPLREGRFKVVDGSKRLAAIRFLVRTNEMVYDALRGFMRPARHVFALIRCRTQSPSAGADETTRKRPGT